MEELLAMFMISGVILVAISIPLIKGRVAPNGLYGFRVRDTLDDPKTWYKTNRYSGKWLLATGLIFIAVCILAEYQPGYLFIGLFGGIPHPHDHRCDHVLAVYEKVKRKQVRTGPVSPVRGEVNNLMVSRFPVKTH
jgi:hypothetical protein